MKWSEKIQPFHLLKDVVHLEELWFSLCGCLSVCTCVKGDSRCVKGVGQTLFMESGKKRGQKLNAKIEPSSPAQKLNVRQAGMACQPGMQMCAVMTVPDKGGMYNHARYVQ